MCRLWRVQSHVLTGMHILLSCWEDTHFSLCSWIPVILNSDHFMIGLQDGAEYPGKAESFLQIENSYFISLIFLRNGEAVPGLSHLEMAILLSRL